MYLLNSFSIAMVDSNTMVTITEVDKLPEGLELESAIGHQDTANVLGVPMNRINVHLKGGDIAYVAQLQGGRLPEGTTTLPKGFSFKYFRIKVFDKGTIERFLYDLYATGCTDSIMAQSNKVCEGATNYLFK